METGRTRIVDKAEVWRVTRWRCVIMTSAAVATICTRDQVKRLTDKNFVWQVIDIFNFTGVLRNNSSSLRHSATLPHSSNQNRPQVTFNLEPIRHDSSEPLPPPPPPLSPDQTYLQTFSQPRPMVTQRVAQNGHNNGVTSSYAAATLPCIRTNRYAPPTRLNHIPTPQLSNSHDTTL